MTKEEKREYMRKYYIKMKGGMMDDETLESLRLERINKDKLMKAVANLRDYWEG